MWDSWEGEPVSRCIVHAFTKAKQQNGLNRPQGDYFSNVGRFYCNGDYKWWQNIKKQKPFVDATALLVTRWFDLSELEDQSCSGY